jgi:alpha-beta hydrolase superfamily lysophospholipase
MGLFFKDDLHDEFGRWPVAYIAAGGAELEEIQVIAREVGDGDDSDFHRCWSAYADRLAAEAEAVLARGHRSSAAALFLKASCFHGASFHPLFGAPVDPRLRATFHKQIACFDRGLALGEPAIEPQRIPFEGTTLPAYLIPAAGRATERRPLLIMTNGYDATITDTYFASAVAASARGYHCLLFDGPGQGELLIEQGLPMRPDWETVVKAVVDFAIALPTVDPARIALSGWSLGGYLAPRAASGEHRLAACIADPGSWGIAAGFRAYVIKLGATPEAAADLRRLDPALVERLWQIVTADRRLRWAVIQRGFWVNGAANLGDYLAKVEEFSLEGRAELIRCPTLLTMAEDDTLSTGAPALFEALRCPKQLIRFTAAEGASSHCEMGNRSLLNRRVLDWLDETFAA